MCEESESEKKVEDEAGSKGVVEFKENVGGWGASSRARAMRGFLQSNKQ